ncbi:MAG TPA: hypothetical protein DCF97_06275 [Plesiomonas shigelloides]|nr:hypothetical protein [Plesiomonas shigelloides]
MMYDAHDDLNDYKLQQVKSLMFSVLTYSSLFGFLISKHLQISLNQRECDIQPDAQSLLSSTSLNDEARTHNQRCTRRRDSHTGEHNNKSGEVKQFIRLRSSETFK